jgi:hypothetical protein
MKLLISLLLCVSAQAADVSISMANNGGTVIPSSTVTAQFTNFGNDTVSVVINGVDKGLVVHPYTVSYTSLPSGVNNIVVTTCSYMGVTSVTTFTTLSSRSYSKAPKR